jgi:hypothetical protein
MIDQVADYLVYDLTNTGITNNLTGFATIAPIKKSSLYKTKILIDKAYLHKGKNNIMLCIADHIMSTSYKITDIPFTYELCSKPYTIYYLNGKIFLNKVNYLKSANKNVSSLNEEQKNYINYIIQRLNIR